MPALAPRSSRRVSSRLHRLRLHHTRALPRTRTLMVSQWETKRHAMILWKRYGSWRNRMVACQTTRSSIAASACHLPLIPRGTDHSHSRMVTTRFCQSTILIRSLRCPRTLATSARAHESLCDHQQCTSSFLTLRSMEHLSPPMRPLQTLQGTRIQAHPHPRVIRRSAAALRPRSDQWLPIGPSRPTRGKSLLRGAGDLKKPLSVRQ